MRRNSESSPFSGNSAANENRKESVIRTLARL
jgi:hypothetical protein